VFKTLRRVDRGSLYKIAHFSFSCAPFGLRRRALRFAGECSYRTTDIDERNHMRPEHKLDLPQAL
jgi:hypothetical protein